VKASKAGLPVTLLPRARGVYSATGYDDFVTSLGVPAADPASLVDLVPVAAPEFTFVDRTYRLYGTRLMSGPQLEPGCLADALRAGPAAGLPDALATGSVKLTADPDKIDGRLR
jgi:hypothetical protein